MEDFLLAASQAAQKAGAMLRDSAGESRPVRYKSPIDLVTDFDQRSQDIILDHLSARFPEHDFLAEEGEARKQGGEFRWIVDPIDGTTNFAHRFPIFCIAIALEYRRNIIVGLVYDPMRDEEFSAVTGQGARLNGKRIRVSSTAELDKSLLATGFPYDIRESEVNNLDHFVNFAVRAQAIRRCGSAALDLCYLACGRFDGFWELKLHPWDVAAASLIVTEAGGRITDFRSSSFNVFGAEALASNGLIHSQMEGVLSLGKHPVIQGQRDDE